MKTIRKQKLLIVWLKEWNKKLEEEMLQGMIKAVRKKLRAMWRDGLDSLL